MQAMFRHGVEIHLETDRQMMPPNAPWIMWLRTEGRHIGISSKLQVTR